jgi:hypothetical protein
LETARCSSPLRSATVRLRGAQWRLEARDDEYAIAPSRTFRAKNKRLQRSIREARTSFGALFLGVTETRAAFVGSVGIVRRFPSDREEDDA